MEIRYPQSQEDLDRVGQELKGGTKISVREFFVEWLGTRGLPPHMVAQFGAGYDMGYAFAALSGFAALIEANANKPAAGPPREVLYPPPAPDTVGDAVANVPYPDMRSDKISSWVEKVVDMTYLHKGWREDHAPKELRLRAEEFFRLVTNGFEIEEHNMWGTARAAPPHLESFQMGYVLAALVSVVPKDIDTVTDK